MYTYNWSRDLQEQLLTQSQKLTNWLNNRTKLLTSTIYQKMGLFHGQPLARADKRDRDSKALQDIDGLIKDPRLFSKEGSSSSESRHVRHSSGSSSIFDDSRPPRPISGPGIAGDPVPVPAINLQTFLTVYKDTRPRVPLHFTNYGLQRDPVTRHGKQLQDLRRTDLNGKLFFWPSIVNVYRST
jgi:hypothetical protein